MIKMTNGGITIEVPAQDVSFYKQAGYSVVKEQPAPVEAPAESEQKPAPVKAAKPSKPSKPEKE